MPRICNNCGAPLQDGAMFCPNCGNQMQQPPYQQQAQPQYQPPRPAYQQPPQPGYGYGAPMPYQQPPKKKRGLGLVALVVIVAVGIMLYFQFKDGKERTEKTSEQAVSTVIKSQETATSQSTEKIGTTKENGTTEKSEMVETTETTETPAAKPQEGMGTGKVKVKDAEFFGVPLPIPDIGTVTEYSTEPKGDGYELIKIRIDGMSYQEYVDYCKQLESIDGWKSFNSTDRFPEDNEDGGLMVVFSGFYRLPQNVTVYYLSDYYRRDTDWPPFFLQVMNY